MIYHILITFIAYIWFYHELKKFPFIINRQIYQEYAYLVDPNLTQKQFLDKSRLQPKIVEWKKLLLFCLPFMLFFCQYDWLLHITFIILVFLSILDILYYLTDIKYIVILFLISLYQLLFNHPEQLNHHIFSLFITILFFTLFHLIVSMISNKEMLGLGDILLFVSLSPFFNLDKLIVFLLYSSLFAIGFYAIYWSFKKQKPTKIPFIPFISLAFLWLNI